MKPETIAKRVRALALSWPETWVTAHITDVESLDAALEWLRESYWLRAPAAVRDAAT
jgi:hypothetical protein